MTGRGRAGGGGGGEVEFLTEKKKSAKKCSWGLIIRCVGGYSLYVILQLLGLFIIARVLG